MKSFLRNLIRTIALRYGKFPGLYRRVCQPMGDEYADYLRRHGKFYEIREHCSILPTTVFTDPAYVRIGNNVHFSSCTLIGHDGVVAMLNRAYDMKLDSVGRIDIGDNVFIGFSAIVLPNVTIGSNAIVTLGDIVGGIPAKPIGWVEDLVQKLQSQTQTLPWANLINQRVGGFDPEVEPRLVQLRVKHFYGHDSHSKQNST